MTIAREIELLDCIREARRLNNQTVRDSQEVDRWHRTADALSARYDGDEVGERWDAPERVENRAWMKRMFGR